MSRVELHAVRKRYGGVDVIHGIDLAIDDGSFCVFVGPSGCGRSTPHRARATFPVPRRWAYHSAPMLCFLPPGPGAPRRDIPEPRRGTAVGVVLAIVLTVAGLLLPWLRPDARRVAGVDPQHAAAPTGSGTEVRTR